MPCFPVGELRASNPGQSRALRDEVREKIWGGPAPVLPRIEPSPDTTNSSDLLARTPSFSEWHGYFWDCGGLPGTYGVVARSLYVQWPGATKLMMYCTGHQQGYFAGSGTPSEYLTSYLRALAANNVDLLLHSMPWFGENASFPVYADPAYANPPYDYTQWHTLLGTRDIHQPTQGHRIRYWVDHVIAGLGRALSLRDYSLVGMSGLSGGSWTTTMVAAIEPRINRSYAIAGSVPNAHRYPGEVGEWEQTTAPCELGVDYHDLYLMAVAEPDRRAMLLHHFNDGVFNLMQISGYAWALRSLAERRGYGKLRFMVDPTATVHDVLPSDAQTILADFLD